MAEELYDPCDGVGLSDLQDVVECDALDARLSSFTTTGAATGVSISLPSPIAGVTIGGGVLTCGDILSKGERTFRPRSTRSEAGGDRIAVDEC